MAETAAEAAYRAALDEIERVKREGLAVLNLSTSPFEALDQIPPKVAEISGLVDLHLNNTAIVDLAPLAGLTALEWLNLSDTGVLDLTPLAGLTALRWLGLGSTFVTDLTPLAHLTTLQGLDLDRTAITDLSPLAALTALEDLSLTRTAVSEIAPLAQLYALQRLDLTATDVSDLSSLAGLTGLQWLDLIETDISDLTPLATLAALQWLSIEETDVFDLGPLQELSALRTLWLDNTEVVDLSPLANLVGLTDLTLHNSRVADLRPIAMLDKLGTGRPPGLSYLDTPAVQFDAELARLASVDNDRDRARQTLAYLNTLPPWPEPYTPKARPDGLPPEPIGGVVEPPEPDPAVPLRQDAGQIRLATELITAHELDDPIRASLHRALQHRVEVLIRVAGNIDEAAYREACDLRDLLANGVEHLDPLLVHLAIEALRRIHGTTPASTDRDYLLALAAVIETGPGLTLDTKQVQLFIDRARRNRLDRLTEADTEAQIRLANSIATSDLSGPDVKSLAIRAAAEGFDDQFTAARPTLVRNYTLLAAQFTLGSAASAVIGDAATIWLAVNAETIGSLAVYWGEPFVAWITPILDRAQQVVEAGKITVVRLRNKP